jgi:hypothetical protein
MGERTAGSWRLCTVQCANHKVRLYKEYHSVCPLVGIGTPQRLSGQRVCPSPQNRGRGTLACRWEVGGGVTIPTTWEKA